MAHKATKILEQLFLNESAVFILLHNDGKNGESLQLFRYDCMQIMYAIRVYKYRNIFILMTRIVS